MDTNTTRAGSGQRAEHVSARASQAMRASVALAPIVLSTSNWLADNSVHTPSHPDPARHNVSGQAGQATPLADGSDMTLARKGLDVAPVVGLFDGGRPAAVIGAVALVVVDSIDGVIFARPWSHVREKGREVAPSVAHSDTASAVVLKAACRWRGTSFPHIAPDSILCSASHSVRGFSQSLGLTAFAPTAFGATAEQVDGKHARHGSALAQAVPRGMSTLAAGSSDHAQAAEYAIN